MKKMLLMITLLGGVVGLQAMTVTEAVIKHNKKVRVGGKSTYFDLSNLGITSLEGLLKVQNINKVDSLYLYDNSISNFDPKYFVGLKNLNTLVIRNNNFSQTFYKSGAVEAIKKVTNPNVSIEWASLIRK
jgi:Leucine-rich repeat (LRR) protein